MSINQFRGLLNRPGDDGAEATLPSNLPGQKLQISGVSKKQALFVIPDTDRRHCIMMTLSRLYMAALACRYVSELISAIALLIHCSTCRLISDAFRP